MFHYEAKVIPNSSGGYRVLRPYGIGLDYNSVNHTFFKVYLAWIPGDQVFSVNDIFGFEGGFGGFRLLRIQWCKKFEPIPWEFSDIPWANLTIFDLFAWV